MAGKDRQQTSVDRYTTAGEQRPSSLSAAK
jgi:hypothetical protein